MWVGVRVHSRGGAYIALLRMTWQLSSKGKRYVPPTRGEEGGRGIFHLPSPPPRHGSCS